MKQYPNRWLLFQYSLLAFPLAFAGLPLYIHAPDFYTRHLGLSLGVIGIVLLLVRLFDAVQDPVIGYLSDRYATRRQMILAFGVLALTVGLLALFFGPQFSIATAIWFAGSMILATSGFSIVAINLNMIGGFWSADQHQRTRIAGWRESFTLFGLLVASILPTIFLNYTEATRAFRWLFIVYAIVMLFAWLMFIKFLKVADLKHLKQLASLSSNGFFQILHDKQRLFFFTYFLTQVAASLPAVLILFFVRDYLKVESYTGLFLFLYFISGAALMQLWFALSKKLDKYRAWLISMVLSIAVFIWVILLEPGDIVSYSIICILSGFALGADLALPASIVADRINARHAEDRATQYYGVMAFIPKLALALASGFSFLMLDEAGFIAAGENTQETLLTLLMLYGLIPCVIKCLAAISLWKLIKTRGKMMNMIKKGVIIMGLMTFINGCATPSMDAYKQTKPQLDLKTYFTGPIKAWGLIQNRSGEVTRRFDVSMHGTWEGDVGTLEEHFAYYDGETQKRVWTITKTGDDTYEGTAADILDKATGKLEGSAMQWAYQMDLPVGDTTYRITFDDWMFLMNDGVLVNRSYLKKFGITMAELTLFMQKQEE